MSISVQLRFPDASLEVCLQQALNWSVWMEHRLPDILFGYFYFNIQVCWLIMRIFWGFCFFSLIIQFSVYINEKGLFSQSTRAGFINGSYICTFEYVCT